MPIIRRDGSVFGTICALDPKPARLRDSKVLATLGLFAELVAAQLEVEERLEASRTALLDAEAMGALREQFIAVLGHDLRNPIAALSAGVEMLSRPPVDDRTAGILAQMRRSCRRMATLVDDILDLARGRLGGGIAVRAAGRGAGRAAARPGGGAAQRPSRPRRSRRRSTWPARCAATRAASASWSPTCWPMRWCMARRTGRCGSRRSGRDGGLTLSVANAGPPIPPATMARLFQPFSRDADGPRAGLGLGLYIAAEVARAHGGTLGVTSDEAATVFTLELPPG